MAGSAYSTRRPENRTKIVVCTRGDHVMGRSQGDHQVARWRILRMSPRARTAHPEDVALPRSAQLIIPVLRRGRR